MRLAIEEGAPWDGGEDFVLAKRCIFAVFDGRSGGNFLSRRAQNGELPPVCRAYKRRFLIFFLLIQCLGGYAELKMSSQLHSDTK